MDRVRAILSPATKWIRGPVTHERHERRAARLLEHLALWLDTTLEVVWFVDTAEAGSCLGLAGAAELTDILQLQVIGRNRA